LQPDIGLELIVFPDDNGLQPADLASRGVDAERQPVKHLLRRSGGGSRKRPDDSNLQFALLRR
jgi:hypothetical protein